MKPNAICVLGGGGFVGHHLINQLVERDYRVRVPVRRREAAKHLFVHAAVEVVESDVHEPAALRQLLTGMEAVINLVGILHETAPGQADSRQDPSDSPRARRGSFRQAHVELPRKLIAACQACGVQRLLHMSALGADADSRSAYQRSKAAGEALVMEAAQRPPGLQVTVFRPSVIFGPGDSFLSMFADLLKFAPVVPLAGGHARFQPVFVGDVARAFAESLDKPETHGRRYALCGPRVYTLAELVRLTARTLGLKRLILPLGQTQSYWFARLMELKPGTKIMTRDNHYAMLTDNVCPDGFPEIFGQAAPLEGMIGYLKEAGPRRQYMHYRTRAGR